MKASKSRAVATKTDQLLSPAFWWQNDDENARNRTLVLITRRKTRKIIVCRNCRRRARNLTSIKLNTKMRLFLLCTEKKLYIALTKVWQRHQGAKKNAKKAFFVTMLIYVNSCFNLAGEDYSNKIRPRTCEKRHIFGTINMNVTVIRVSANAMRSSHRPLNSLFSSLDHDIWDLSCSFTLIRDDHIARN